MTDALPKYDNSMTHEVITDCRMDAGLQQIVHLHTTFFLSA